MTRMFTGGRDGGGGGNPIFSKYEKRSAKDVFMKKMRGIDDSNLTPEERYQKNFDKKVDELRQKALTGGSKYSFTMPGTSGEQQEKKLSKGMEIFIQRVAAKKAKEELKKEQERAKIDIKAKYLTGIYGGSIAKDGKIYGPDRRLIAKINPKTGKIMSQGGVYIGKYDPKSPMSEHKIQQFIAQEYNPNKKNWMGNPAGGGGMGNFYGGSSNSGGGMGSFYGHKDDKGGGFWG